MFRYLFWIEFGDMIEIGRVSMDGIFWFYFLMIEIRLFYYLVIDYKCIVCLI